MLFKSIVLKKIIFTIFIVVTVLNCSGGHGDSNPAEAPRSPVGEYELTHVRKKIVGEGGSPYVTEDCDLLSSFKFKSNMSIEFVNHNLNNDEDCSDFEMITGDWMSTGSTSGGFLGDLNFNSTFNGYNIYNGSYSSQGQDGIRFNLYFRVVIEGVEYSYIYVFSKI